jgi:hypothetical protein
MRSIFGFTETSMSTRWMLTVRARSAICSARESEGRREPVGSRTGRGATHAEPPSDEVWRCCLVLVAASKLSSVGRSDVALRLGHRRIPQPGLQEQKTDAAICSDASAVEVPCLQAHLAYSIALRGTGISRVSCAQRHP